uniref:Uncharacterized protein n=1 Tax=Mus musculus TaxID=10090 RepID=Q3UPY1_MOUSE|nr:unnamed protein product [Mus musculus]
MVLVAAGSRTKRPAHWRALPGTRAPSRPWVRGRDGLQQAAARGSRPATKTQRAAGNDDGDRDPASSILPTAPRSPSAQPRSPALPTAGRASVGARSQGAAVFKGELVRESEPPGRRDHQLPSPRSPLVDTARRGNELEGRSRRWE